LQIWFQNRRMKDKRQRMAFTWPPYVDPTLYAYLFNAAAASAAASLQQPYPYTAATSSPPTASLPPCLPPSASAMPLSGLYASVGLQRVAAAAAVTSSSSLSLGLPLPPINATPLLGGGFDPLSAMMRPAAVAANGSHVSRPLPVIGTDSNKGPGATGHVVGMPCACSSCCYAAAVAATHGMMTSSKGIMSAAIQSSSGSLFQPFKQEIDRSS